MVIIRFRTSQNKSYKIELEPTSTISQAKENLSKIIGNNADHTKFKMLFKARMLKDDQTIESLNLKANDSIFVHVFLPKSKINFHSNVYPINSEEAAQVLQELTSDNSTIPVNPVNPINRVNRVNPINRVNPVNRVNPINPPPRPVSSTNQDDPSERVFRRMLEIEPRAIENIVTVYEHFCPDIRDHLPDLITLFGLNPDSFNLENLRNRTEPPLSRINFSILLARACSELGVDPIQGMRSQRINVPQPGIFGNNQVSNQFSQIQNQSVQPQNQLNQILAQFSPDERDAIQRLQNLGNFSLEYVIQMYVAADKNENVAANLLFGN